MMRRGFFMLLPFFSISKMYVKLLFRDSAYGALCCASAAIDALVGIDLVVVVSLRNCAYGALGLAGAAADALVADLMSHYSISPFI